MPYTLYAVRDEHNSEAAMNLAESAKRHAQLNVEVVVMDAAKVLREELPSELHGVPTMVDMENGQQLTGSEVFTKLETCINDALCRQLKSGTVSSFKYPAQMPQKKKLEAVQDI